jgi:hypothetical protein
MKRFIGNLALTMAALSIALLIGEGLVRVFLADQIVLFPRYHTDAQYGEFTIRRLRPNTVFWHRSVDGDWKFVTNAQGFRNDRDFSVTKPEGTVRILSLGDSHTEGFEVRQDQTFSAVAERYMEREGIDAEVINAGVSGFSVAEALVFLENEGVKYQPDFVVLGLFANDLVDNIKAGIFASTEDGLIVKKKDHIPGVRILNLINRWAVMRWLSENSYLYSYAFNSVWAYAKELLTSKTKARLQTEYAVAVDEVDDYQIQLMGRLIGRMYEFCRRNNITLIVLDIPRRSMDTVFRSSVPPALYQTVQANSDFFVHSEDVFNKYQNIAELHVPNGHNHISAFSHLMYGVEVGQIVLQTRNAKLSEQR